MHLFGCLGVPAATTDHEQRRLAGVAVATAVHRSGEPPLGKLEKELMATEVRCETDRHLRKGAHRFFNGVGNVPLYMAGREEKCGNNNHPFDVSQPQLPHALRDGGLGQFQETRFHDDAR